MAEKDIIFAVVLFIAWTIGCYAINPILWPKVYKKRKVYNQFTGAWTWQYYYIKKPWRLVPSTMHFDDDEGIKVAKKEFIEKTGSKAFDPEFRTGIKLFLISSSFIFIPILVGVIIECTR